MNLSPVNIETREDALVWRLVDAIFTGGDAVNLCRQFELDLYSERAEAILDNERLERLRELIRDTSPERIEAAA